MDSMEALRAHLWKLHQTTVDIADPVLMVYSIHQVALADMQRHLDQANRALSDQVRGIVAGATSDIRAVVDLFKADATAEAVKAKVEAIQEAAKLADTSQTAFRRSTRLLSILTAINLTAVVFVLGALTVLTH